MEYPLWDRLLESLSKGDPDHPRPGGSPDMLRKVLTRVALAQEPVPRSAISKGSMLIRQTPLASGTVGKAVDALEDKGLLIADGLTSTPQPGPSITPLRLSDTWAIVGIHIDQQHEGPDKLSGVICGLDRKPLCKPDEWEVPRDGDQRNLRELAEAIRKLTEALLAQLTGRHRFLGVGVEIGGHIHHGIVKDSVHAGWSQEVRLHEVLTEVLDEVPELKDVPVVVENDVSALAIHGYYERSLDGLDVALIAVFRQGVGGALILNGRVYRGFGSMAPEPGHLSVEYPEDQPGWTRPPAPGTVAGRTFGDECLCSTKERKAYGHVDTLAVPARIEAQLAAVKQGQTISLDEAAAAPLATSRDGDENTLVFTDEAVVLRRAGRALGRGLREIINIVNPGQLVLRLPQALAVPAPQSSGAEYLAAVEREIDGAYSTGAADARGRHLRLKVQSYADEQQVAREGAVAAATTVFNAFLEHARGAGSRSPARPA